MKFISAIAAAASICAASPAFSALITFDSVGLSDQNPVSTEYQASEGLVFSGAGVLANGGLWSSAAGNTSAFAVAALNETGASFTLSAFGPVDKAFLEGPFSFSYSTLNAVDVKVFDGNSNLLSTYSLSANDDGTGNTWGLFNVASLAAGAKIIEFGGDAGLALYDNIVVTAVPLPAALLLFPFGAAALGAAARRRKAAAAV
jgi:hypothetical protein